MTLHAIRNRTTAALGLTLLLLLPRPSYVNTFSITNPYAARRGPTAHSVRDRPRTRLLLASAVVETASKDAADMKMTKEAAELLQVLLAKERGDEGAHALLIAQVSPAVR